MEVRAKGEYVEGIDDLERNDKVCFSKNLKAELVERKKELEEISEDARGLIKPKGAAEASTSKVGCGSTELVNDKELEHDNGENDGLGSNIEVLADEGDGDSEDEDFFVKEGEDESEDEDCLITEGEDENEREELLVDEGEDDSEDVEADFLNDLGQRDDIGPFEEFRAHENGSFFMVGDTFADKSELVKAINNLQLRME